MLLSVASRAGFEPTLQVFKRAPANFLLFKRDFCLLGSPRKERATSEVGHIDLQLQLVLSVSATVEENRFKRFDDSPARRGKELFNFLESGRRGREKIVSNFFYKLLKKPNKRRK